MLQGLMVQSQLYSGIIIINGFIRSFPFHQSHDVEVVNLSTT